MTSTADTSHREAQIGPLVRSRVLVVCLVVGRPDLSENTRVKPRLPQSAVLHHERYDAAGHADDVAGYEERIGEFYAIEGLAHSWVERVLARLSGPEALTGRHRLRSALEDQGFPLR